MKLLRVLVRVAGVVALTACCLLVAGFITLGGLWLALVLLT